MVRNYVILGVIIAMIFFCHRVQGTKIRSPGTAEGGTGQKIQ